MNLSNSGASSAIPKPVPRLDASPSIEVAVATCFSLATSGTTEFSAGLANCPNAVTRNTSATSGPICVPNIVGIKKQEAAASA